MERMTIRILGRAVLKPTKGSKVFGIHDLVERLAYHEDKKEKEMQRIYECDIFNNLKMIMGEKNMSQNELARKAGISVPQVNLYYNGKSEPTATRIVKIAKALGVSTDELILKRGKGNG